jgi:TRAP-type C4-dicarboxylate transport system permease small subunit
VAANTQAGGLAACERVLLAGNRGLIIAMMAAMVALVFTNVVSRYIFNVSIIWAEELSQYLMVWITFLGAGLAMREGRHVAVEMLQDALPPRLARTARVIVVIFILAFLATLVILGVMFVSFAWDQETPVMNIPTGIPYLAVPIGAFLFFVHMAFISGDFLHKRVETPESTEAGGEDG